MTCGIVGEGIPPEVLKTKTGYWLAFYDQQGVVHDNHRNHEKSRAKKAVDETTGKEKTTICQDKALVAGHAEGGQNRGQLLGGSFGVRYSES